MGCWCSAAAQHNTVKAAVPVGGSTPYVRMFWGETTAAPLSQLPQQLLRAPPLLLPRVWDVRSSCKCHTLTS